MPAARVPLNLAIALYTAERHLRETERRLEALPGRMTREDALALHTAERNLRNAETRVQAVLGQLFESWRGWAFTAPAELNVYMANYSAGAAAMLHVSGFVTVTIHSHQAARFLTCDCRVSEIPK